MQSRFLMPKLLYGYLATEMLAPFFASFLIINCVFFLVKLIPFLDFVLSLGISFADFVRLFAYLFPNIFLYTIPMAAMLGVTIGFARLSSDSEILALKAGGISMYTIIPPVLLVTLIIAIITGYFSIRLIPLSEIAMKQLTSQLITAKVSKGIKTHAFTEALGDVVVYVDSIDKKTQTWHKVWVSDMRDVKIPVITMASTGSMISDVEKLQVTINLENGSMHKPGKASAQIVEFDRYQIKIPLNTPSSKQTRIKKHDILDMQGLLKAAAATPEDTEDHIEEKRNYLIEYHKRMVLPAGCMLISLLGLPLGLQARPGKKAAGIQAGLGIFILYYVIFTMGKSLGEKGTLPVGFAVWLPDILFSLLTVFWLYRTAKEKSLFPDFFLQLWERFTEKIRIIFRALWAKRTQQRQEELQKNEQRFRLRRNKLVHGNPKLKIYHVRGCPYYNDDDCTLSFKDTVTAAQAGFKPCTECRHIAD